MLRLICPSISHPQAGMDFAHHAPDRRHPSEPSPSLVIVACCVTAVVLAVGFLMR
jgi:hypothetical protein